jgi:hypothetical protein
VKFYARLAPGVQDRLDELVTLSVHMPKKAIGGVVVKLWELATYTGTDGEVSKDDGTDDLLIELHGELLLDDAAKAKNQVKLVVSKTVIPPPPKDAKLDTLKLKVAFGDTYDVPLLSTHQELQGQNFELAISIEQGGSEVFRSKAPLFVRPKLVNPRAVLTPIIAGRDGDDELGTPDAFPLIGRYATIGTATEDDPPKLAVLGGFRIADHGRLAAVDDDGKRLDDELAMIRTGRKLYAYVTRSKPELAKTVGPSKIPIDLCHELGADGLIDVQLHPPDAPFLGAPAHVTIAPGDREERSRDKLAEVAISTDALPPDGDAWRAALGVTRGG